MVRTLIRWSVEGLGVSLLMCSTMMLAVGIVPSLGLIEAYGITGFFSGIVGCLVVGMSLLSISEII